MGTILVTVTREVPSKLYEVKFVGDDVDASIRGLLDWLRGDDAEPTKFPEPMALGFYDDEFIFYTHTERLQWAHGFEAARGRLALPDKRLRCPNCDTHLIVPKHPGPFRCKNCKADYSLGHDGKVTRVWGKDCGSLY